VYVGRVGEGGGGEEKSKIVAGKTEGKRSSRTSARG